MKIKSTIAEIIETQDSEVYGLLRKILERPELFFGAARFDYFCHFFNGFCQGRGTDVDFIPDKELQYWLLHTQSASFYGEIRGSTLFDRCFGIGKIAFEKYKEFLQFQKPENHDCLIAIHANVKNTSTEVLRKFGCDVFDIQDYDFFIIPCNIDYVDEKTFHCEYLKWKNEVCV